MKKKTQESNTYKRAKRSALSQQVTTRLQGKDTTVYCVQLIETARVRQSAIIHCQIRLVYSKSGVIAYVRFTRATNRSADDKGDQLYTLACLVNVYLSYRLNSQDLKLKDKIQVTLTYIYYFVHLSDPGNQYCKYHVSSSNSHVIMQNIGQIIKYRSMSLFDNLSHCATYNPCIMF